MCSDLSPERSQSAHPLGGVREAGAYLALVSGLLRQAGVKTGETLVAASDEAVWIENLCQSLGIPQVIDVFYTTQYMFFYELEFHTQTSLAEPKAQVIAILVLGKTILWVHL
ncbi:MAG: hypothetical protein KatS3mg070_2293 [Meiothermus sp.]|nr:MAG: hypothetical protein KatS3mg070_2293 [Meiothermus sp.]